MTRRWVSILCCAGCSAWACDNASDNVQTSPAPPSASVGKEERYRGFRERFQSQSAEQRKAALQGACLVGRECDPAEMMALFEVVESEERDALQKLARPLFLKQAAAALAADNIKVEDLSAAGPKQRSVQFGAERCDGFLVEKVANRLGKIARRIGFDELVCKTKGSTAKVPL